MATKYNWANSRWSAIELLIIHCNDHRKYINISSMCALTLNRYQDPCSIDRLYSKNAGGHQPHLATLTLSEIRIPFIMTRSQVEGMDTPISLYPYINSDLMLFRHNCIIFSSHSSPFKWVPSDWVSYISVFRFFTPLSIQTELRFGLMDMALSSKRYYCN